MSRYMKGIIIPPDAEYCPECGTKLEVVKCPCHRWCDGCKKTIRVNLGETLEWVGDKLVTRKGDEQVD